MTQDVYFSVRAANRLLVRTTGGYWQKIVTFKHPAMLGKEDDVKLALESPDEIRQSKRNENVLLFYRGKGDYHTCVVVRAMDDEGFIVTAYETDKIKEGKTAWKR